MKKLILISVFSILTGCASMDVQPLIEAGIDVGVGAALGDKEVKSKSFERATNKVAKSAFKKEKVKKQKMPRGVIIGPEILESDSSEYGVIQLDSDSSADVSYEYHVYDAESGDEIFTSEKYELVLPAFQREYVKLKPMVENAVVIFIFKNAKGKEFGKYQIQWSVN